MATIYELAKKIGYSVSTISKVLNNYSGVNANTREKVLAAVKKYNYVPNINAQSLMSKRSYMIGALILDGPNDILSPHLSEILSAFKFECANQGYDITFLSNRMGKTGVTYREHCLARNLDGVLLAIGMDNLLPEHIDQLRELIELDMPKVSVEGFHKNVSTIISDNVNGTIAGLEYLYSLGHRQIGIVTIAGQNAISEQRLEGYRRFLEKRALPYRADFVFPVTEFSYRAGLEAVDAIRQKKQLTALFSIYDEISLGLIQGLKNVGIAIPDDLSLVSFDDIMIAKYSGLTTLRQNREKIGSLAAKRLIALIEDKENAKNENTLIETELIVRSSCKAIG